MRHSDLWLKWITPFVRQPQSLRFPCSHCGSTSHYPENYNFRPYVVQNTLWKTTRKVSPATFGIPFCIYFNHSQCLQTLCWFLHKCEHCGENHPGKTCQDGACLPNKPLPWTPMQPFILEWKLSNYLDKALVEQLTAWLQHRLFRTSICSLSKNLASASQKPDKIDATLDRECKAGRILGPFASPPLPNVYTSGLGLVPKHDGGWRIIIISPFWTCTVQYYWLHRPLIILPDLLHNRWCIQCHK